MPAKLLAISIALFYSRFQIDGQAQTNLIQSTMIKLI